MFRRKLIPNTGLRKTIVRREKAKAMGPKGASGRALNP